VSDEMLDAAVALAFAFDMKEKPAIVKRFIGLEFRFYSEGLDDDRVLDRIKKGIVPALAESLRNLCRATEEFTQALKIVTQSDFVSRASAAEQRGEVRREMIFH